MFFALYSILSFKEVFKAPSDKVFLKTSSSRSLTIAFLISLTSIGFTMTEFDSSRTSQLNGKLEEIIDNPQAIASTTA